MIKADQVLKLQRCVAPACPQGDQIGGSFCSPRVRLPWRGAALRSDLVDSLLQLNQPYATHHKVPLCPPAPSCAPASPIHPQLIWVCLSSRVPFTILKRNQKDNRSQSGGPTRGYFAFGAWDWGSIIKGQRLPRITMTPLLMDTASRRQCAERE